MQIQEAIHASENPLNRGAAVAVEPSGVLIRAALVENRSVEKSVRFENQSQESRVLERRRIGGIEEAVVSAGESNQRICYEIGSQAEVGRIGGNLESERGRGGSHRAGPHLKHASAGGCGRNRVKAPHLKSLTVSRANDRAHSYDLKIERHLDQVEKCY